MDKSSRIRLIREIRAHLVTLNGEDQDLLLLEFGLGVRREGWNGEPMSLSQILQAGDDDDIVAMASHVQAETSSTSDLATAPPLAAGPLLVFASHLAAYKRLVGEVETELTPYGVSLFVAHTSIEPDKQWHDEIIKTLDTSHAGVAFLHKRFKDSAWCDQEVGWLLGRRVPVFSLMFDQDPYGPLGERQAVNANGLDAKTIASKILDVMFGRTQLHGHLASSLVEAMKKSGGFNTTDAIWGRLRDMRNLTTEQCETLLDALENNAQVAQIKHPWPNSPWDGGRPYVSVIPEFIEKQPGAQAEPVKQRLAVWAARLEHEG